MKSCGEMKTTERALRVRAVRDRKTFWLGSIVIALACAGISAAETLATEEQAIRITLPNALSVEPQTRTLTPEQKEALQKATGLRFPEKEFHIFVGQRKQGPEGYALLMNEIGKHEYITFMVGVTPKFEAGEVVVMEYRETRGWEVKEKRFLRQFHGKKVTDPIEVNRDIVNYTGATLSSHAMARGVKKALALAELFYGSEGAH
jgi:Na+-translocating ferredoxin:NAD+ oxidoreductase subunit G